MDAWSRDRRLYRGPFLGGVFGVDDAVAEVACCMLPVLGGFDADGDGVVDVMVAGGHVGIVHHGPFAGALPRWTDDPEATVFGVGGASCPTGRGAHLVRAYFGPGRDAWWGIGKGPGGDCGVDTTFYGLQGPRGRRLGPEDAFSRDDTLASGITSYAGIDIDGDGDAEVLRGQHLLSVHDSPVAPWIGDTAIAWPDPSADRIVAAAGDIDGDGRDDLVALVDVASGRPWTGLLLAPFDTTQPIADQAVPLAAAAASGASIAYGAVGRIAMDLDGDGRSDLVARQRGPDRAGTIAIWYGADIAAAIGDRRGGR